MNGALWDNDYMTFISTINGPISIIFWIHVIAGTVALCTFLIPLLTQKGGTVHRRTGWIYVLAMISVSLSAFVITPWRMFFDSSGTRESQMFAVFLFFISAFSITAIWFGLRVLRFKNRKIASYEFSAVGPPLILMGIAGGTCMVGVYFNNSLLIWFPLVALRLGWTQFNYWRNPPGLKMHWWYAHMTGMVTGCIATVTAFLVTAFPRLVQIPELTNSIFLWLTPTIIAVPILSIWLAYYRKKFREL